MKSYDAIIVGAGPAGGSTAFFLAKAGLNVAVIERAEYPRRKVCGEFVSATTFPILDTIGIGDAARSGGGPPVSRLGVCGREAIVTAPMPVPNSGSGAGRTVHRDLLDAMLLEAARNRGAEVYQPWKAVGLETDSDGHRLTIESGGEVQTLRAPIIVAAHGSWEPGSLPTQPAKSNAPSDLLAFKAYYHGATFDSDLITLVGFPDGYGGMVYRDADTLGFSVCIRRDRISRCRTEFPAANAGESVLQYVAKSVRGIAEALEGATYECPPFGAGPMRPGIRTGYTNGIFRVGNAAGEAHPAIAEGISIAIQSGVLLANHLAGCSGAWHDRRVLDRVGERYASEWRAVFGRRLLASKLYAKACMSPRAGLLLAPVLEAFPRLLTIAAVLSGKSQVLSETLHPCPPAPSAT